MISFITLASNPFSNNFLTFYPCLNSFATLVDEIIVVSGGTNDNSFTSEYLSNEAKDKLVVVESNKTIWDYNNNFSPNHASTMFNEGLKIAKGDWVIINPPKSQIDIKLIK